MKIGLLDSGIGGLNVLKEIINKFPNNEFYYFGDTLNMPYGDKTIDELKKLTFNNVSYLVKKCNIELLIVACGTLSSTCLEFMRENFNIPVIDVISPTLNYLNNDNINDIGVIATKRTIESQIFKIKDKNVKMLATPEFVPIIESGTIEQNKKIIEDKLSYFGKDIKFLVLGCTHYPLLSRVINDYINVQLVDMGKVLANSIVLENNSLQKITLYFTKVTNQLKINIKMIIKNEFELKELKDL